MGSEPLTVTTSWDDGHELDARVAELLIKHDLPGCFYVPRTNPERPVMSMGALRDLATHFEIGGHTLNHVRLTDLSPNIRRAEIRGCKAWLEDEIGRPVTSFCYPGGAFDGTIATEVASAGFGGARTADWLTLDPGRDPFRIAPALHLYPHGAFTHVAHCVRRGHGRGLLLYLTRAGRPTGPAALAAALARELAKIGGVLHVWGHSWEIEDRGLWTELDQTLQTLATLVRTGARAVDGEGLASWVRGRNELR